MLNVNYYISFIEEKADAASFAFYLFSFLFIYLFIL